MNACILLGVWGEKYIKDFLQLSLLSLLAPGNIPALSKAYKTKFIFLTRSYDMGVFESEPAFQKLKQYCEIEFIPINDLIVIGNYSTTLTLAFDRAIKHTGEKMLETYFIFLTSDYIMANGSFEGLMRYMSKGYSGICAGNFQVVQEDIEPYLLSQINHDKLTIEISPRDLVKQSLEHLHPITTTSFYDQTVVHNYKANRFYCRPDPETLAGRFYLLHMLCIKPETMNYQIKSSCDYSFIPEMCPSGNIGIITDSDDYLVVEVQSRDHELGYIHWGAYNLKKLVTVLAEWTTKQHRENAQHTIFYHANELSLTKKTAIDAELQTFINSISKHLNHHECQPHRHHPYWIGAVELFDQYQELLKDHHDYDFLNLNPLNSMSKRRKLFYRLFGLPPDVYPWHYRWNSYRQVRDILEKDIHAAGANHTVVLYDSFQTSFMRYCHWLKEALGLEHHYNMQNLSLSKMTMANLKQKSFTLCVLFIRLSDLKNLRNTFIVIKNLLAENGKLIVCIPNTKNQYPRVIYDFPREFGFTMNYLVNPHFKISNVATIQDNMTFYGSLAIDQVQRYADYDKKLNFITYLALAMPAAIAIIAKNIISAILKRKPKGHCTDILVNMSPILKTTGNT